MAKRAEKKIDWRPGETYNQARNRWWNSMSMQEKKQVLKEAEELGREFVKKMFASRRKSAA
jgi:predicted Fe-S protein YdhL (DUF1289 family)